MAQGMGKLFKMLERINRTNCLPDSGMNARVKVGENITIIKTDNKGKRKIING